MQPEGYQAAPLDVVEKEVRRVAGLTFSSMKEGSVFIGYPNLPLASLIYQEDGNKMIACIDVTEALELMHECPIAETQALSGSEQAGQALEAWT